VVALAYDLFPVLALACAGSALMLLARGGTPVNPGSAGAYAETAWLWALCGAYFVASWRRGGQTLGMRPWRVKVVAADGSKPSRKALILRFAVGHLSLLLCGLGFWWAWIDREKRTWHDRASGTRVVRVVKQSRQASP
jgi:uncharacterized RDD family membrane protein YckC